MVALVHLDWTPIVCMYVYGKGCSYLGTHGHHEKEKKNICYEENELCVGNIVITNYLLSTNHKPRYSVTNTTC